MSGTDTRPPQTDGRHGDQDAPARYVTSAVEQFAAWGERTALIHGARALTFQQLLDLAYQSARVFEDSGLRRGDGLVLLAANPLEMLGVGLAAHLMGVRYTPVYVAGGGGDQVIEHILRDAAPAAVVVGDGGPAAPASRLLATARRAGVARRFTLGPGATATEDEAVDLLAAAARRSPAPFAVRAREDDVARVLYTGGTTGPPKGVAYSFGALGAATGAWAGTAPPPRLRFLAVTPIAHAAGAIAFGLLRQGVTVELFDTFDAGVLLSRIGAASAASRLVTTYLYPPYLYRLLDHPELAGTDLAALASVTYGSAPMAPHQLARAVARLGPRLRQGYALTEAIAISGLSPEDHALAASSRPELFASVGRPVPGVRVRITGPDGRELPTGEAGAVRVSGPTVMEGYWNRPDLTAGALREGWLRTGDLGRVDADGYLYLTGRETDLVIVDGANCSPQAVEHTLARHPAVRQAAVLGVPDARTGEALLAVVQTDAPPDPAAPGLEEELRRLVREALGPAHVPTRIAWVTRLPTASYGKPDKAALRRRFAP